MLQGSVPSHEMLRTLAGEEEEEGLKGLWHGIKDLIRIDRDGYTA